MNPKENISELIANFCDHATITRSKNILNQNIKIMNFNKISGIIEAEIKGSRKIPYKIVLNSQNNRFSDIFKHDCPDFLTRRRPFNRFCKHIAKLFFFLAETDCDYCLKMLRKLETKTTRVEIDLDENENKFDGFLNRTIPDKLNFTPKGFDSFFSLIELDNDTIKAIKEILSIAKKLPAAMGGFHGAYDGGLYDHTLLTTNFAYNIGQSVGEEIDIKNLVFTAIIHDFGKISHYSRKRNLSNYLSNISERDFESARNEIMEIIDASGEDEHVESAYIIAKEFLPKIILNNEIVNALVFHHGGWSKYQPLRMNPIAVILHSADMIASQVYFI